MNLTQTIGRSIGDLADYLGGISRYNATASSTPPTPPPSYAVRGVKLSDQDLNTLRNTLFAEISNRTPDKQALEARTITNTALNRIPQYAQRGKTMSLSDVLSAPNQYQGYNSPEYKRLASGNTGMLDNQKINTIDSTIAQLKSGTFPDNTNGSVFYHHDPQGRIWLKAGSLYAPRTVANLM